MYVFLLSLSSVTRLVCCDPPVSLISHILGQSLHLYWRYSAFRHLLQFIPSTITTTIHNRGQQSCAWSSLLSAPLTCLFLWLLQMSINFFFLPSFPRPTHLSPYPSILFQAFSYSTLHYTSNAFKLLLLPFPIVQVSYSYFLYSV